MPLARARSSAHRFRVHSRAYCNRRACSSGIFTHFSTASGPGSSKLLRKLDTKQAWWSFARDRFSSGARKIYWKFTSHALHGNLKNLLSGLHVARSSLYTGINGSEKIAAASVSKTPAPPARIMG